ncbi:MAG: Maf family protein, partial [Chloroflexota bacterium]|nr:Maf family protein [Chloroflexota bacterium]
MSSFLPLLLASASPRRRQILSLLGLLYTVGVSPINEEEAQACYLGRPERLAQWLAEQKALGVQTLPEAANSLIITADTTVLLDGTILGKPR